MAKFLPLMDVLSPNANAQHGVDRHALTAYERGELSANEVVSLGQIIYEAGVLPKLPPRYFLLLEHLKRNGLIHVNGRALH